MSNEAKELISEVEQYHFKREELINFAIENVNLELLDILERLSLDTPNILWELMDADLSLELLASEIERLS